MFTLFTFPEPLIRLCASLTKIQRRLKWIVPVVAVSWFLKNFMALTSISSVGDASTAERLLTRWSWKIESTGDNPRGRHILSIQSDGKYETLLRTVVPYSGNARHLKCPNCFSTKVKLCEEENIENALCTECDCKFEFNPELTGRWD